MKQKNIILIAKEYCAYCALKIKTLFFTYSQCLFFWTSCIIINYFLSLNALGQKISKKCNFVEFPNHPMQHFRKSCDTVLMKTVSSSKSKLIAPKKVYSFKSFRESFQSLLKRDGFLELLLKGPDKCSCGESCQMFAMVNFLIHLKIVMGIGFLKTSATLV